MKTKNAGSAHDSHNLICDLPQNNLVPLYAIQVLMQTSHVITEYKKDLTQG